MQPSEAARNTDDPEEEGGYTVRTSHYVADRTMTRRIGL